ncbi:hypothetical protein L210DRAFT_3574562, partial [Boletus edulis BED1]
MPELSQRPLVSPRYPTPPPALHPRTQSPRRQRLGQMTTSQTQCRSPPLVFLEHHARTTPECSCS